MSLAPAPGADVVYRDPLRQAQLRKKAWTNALIGIASLIGFTVVIVLLIGRSSGWAAVQETFFSGEQFATSFPEVLSAFWLNVRIFLIAEPIILIVGLLVALGRGLRAPIFLPLRVVATVYVDVFRGVPHDPRHLSTRFRHARLAPAGCSLRPDLLGDRGTGALLRRLCGRSLPRRDQLGASLAAHGRAITGLEFGAD